MQESCAKHEPVPGGHNDCHLLGELFAQRIGNTVGPHITNSLTSEQRAELIDRFIVLLKKLSRLMRFDKGTGERPGLDKILADLIATITRSLDADRSTLFLYDSESDELISRVAEGPLAREIRFSSHQGIAGKVFRSGRPLIIHDAYNDPHFNPDIDEQTGYRTRSILCVPLKNWDDKIIGVTEVLNKNLGKFNAEDLALLEALTSHAASALESMQLYENVERALHDEAQMLGITSALSSELQLDTLLVKIMEISTEVLNADRSTLLLYDQETGELCSKVAQGLGQDEIRIPSNAGIAGSVFTSRRPVNIPDAYADLRFNPEVDRTTGYHTRSILCVPVVSHAEQTIGIIQVLNKRGGPFKERDEQRLTALASQAAVAIENARLFEAMLNARNYSESILQSLSNGVITLDSQRRVMKANPAASRILRRSAKDLQGDSCAHTMGALNPWISEALDKVEANQRPESAMDASIKLEDGSSVSVNLTVEPFTDANQNAIGFMLIFEDLTEEKRVKSTMARYMSHELSERLLDSNEALLGGQEQKVTILFSDIRDFTGMTEHMGAQATVAMLNEYFSEMGELVFKHDGILDKYIGDALMALFGTPFPGPNDADNALRAAIGMVRSLRRFNDQRMQKGHLPIDIRVGINTGEVIVGNIGCLRRMDYTVIGHTVNVASRVEAANSFYGTRILATGLSLQALKGDYLTRELDLVRVKGSSTPVAIHEILDAHDEIELPDPEGLIKLYGKALQLYREREWFGAAECFRQALAVAPADQPSRLFLSRCRNYSLNPPDPDWDGVWSMVQK